VKPDDEEETDLAKARPGSRTQRSSRVRVEVSAAPNQVAATRVETT